MSEKSVFDKMEDSALEVVRSIRRVNGDYMMIGLILGLYKPSMGWAILGLTTALPTIIFLKHSEWIQHLQYEKIEHALLFLLLLLASDMYAFHCLSMALGFN